MEPPKHVTLNYTLKKYLAHQMNCIRGSWQKCLKAFWSKRDGEVPVWWSQNSIKLWVTGIGSHRPPCYCSLLRLYRCWAPLKDAVIIYGLVESSFSWALLFTAMKLDRIEPNGPLKRVTLNYVLNNIHIPTDELYKRKLIETSESILKRMRSRSSCLTIAE